MTPPTCAFCGKEIKTMTNTWVEQVGWAKRRAKGGLNALLGRQATGRLACSECGTGIKYGVSPGIQEKLDV